MVKTVTVLGSTGSIGKSTVKLLLENRDKFRVVALTANSNNELLAEQAKQLNAQFTATSPEAICEAAAMEADIVIAGIVGLAGLKPVMKAIERGARIGLANKEAMVCAGAVMTEAAKKSGAEIIPIDSEHNAIFQVFDFNNLESIEKVILTASGGPFRNLPVSEFKNITVEQALRHPKWNMGAKISIDSATMMNKGLELIEAYNLFPIKAEQLGAIIHPESIIHSMVYYNDGSVLAHAANPDMCVPISYVLGYPERLRNNAKRLDLTECGKLHFEKPDYEKFPCLKIAEDVLDKGQSYHIVLNAVNEVAVEKFLKREIPFTDIARLAAYCVNAHNAANIQNLSDVFTLDAETRAKALEFCGLAA